MTIDERWKMLAEQDNLCAVCDKHLTIFGVGLDDACIDHDHTTGRVRGVLCGACNRVLGFLRDSIPTALRVVEYLEKGREVFRCGTRQQR